jgi:post-segregation antitoxin (ccd killing protein)
MSRNIYVRDADLALWERAERYARERRLTMSALIMTALEAYLRDHDPDRGG